MQLQPLADNGLPLGRVLLVDNEARKAAHGEQTSMIAVPTWEQCKGGWAEVEGRRPAVGEDRSLYVQGMREDDVPTTQIVR